MADDGKGDPASADGGADSSATSTCSLADFPQMMQEGVWTEAEYAACEATCAEAADFGMCAAEMCEGVQDFGNCQLANLNVCHAEGGACQAALETALCCSQESGCATSAGSIEDFTACITKECEEETTGYDTCVGSIGGQACLIEASEECASKPADPDAGDAGTDAGTDAG